MAKAYDFRGIHEKCPNCGHEVFTGKLRDTQTFYSPRYSADRCGVVRWHCGWCWRSETLRYSEVVV